MRNFKTLQKLRQLLLSRCQIGPYFYQTVCDGICIFKNNSFCRSKSKNVQIILSNRSATLPLGIFARLQLLCKPFCRCKPLETFTIISSKIAIMLSYPNLTANSLLCQFSVSLLMPYYLSFTFAMMMMMMIIMTIQERERSLIFNTQSTKCLDAKILYCMGQAFKKCHFSQKRGKFLNRFVISIFCFYTYFSKKVCLIVKKFPEN